MIEFLKKYSTPSIAPIGAILMAVAFSGSSAFIETYSQQIFVFGCVIFLVGTILIYSYTKRNTKLSAEIAEHKKKLLDIKKDNIFFLVVNFCEKWQVELEYSVLKASRDFNWDVTFFTALDIYTDASYENLFNRICEKREKFAGGFVILHRWNERVYKIANEYMIPTVILDAGVKKYDEKYKNNRFVANVSYSDAEGGIVAAQKAVDLMCDSDKANIYVIAGPAKMERQNEFKQYIASKKPNWKVTVTLDGRFNKMNSYNICKNLLEQKNGPSIDMFFCTADSMTLGCLEAINKVRKRKTPHVIGYDGIKETRNILDHDSSSPLKCLVHQDPKEVAHEGAKVLNKIIKRENIDNYFIEVKPNYYPRNQ